MRSLFLFAAALATATAAPAQPKVDRCAATANYDPAAAWAAFEDQLTYDYAYLARGGAELPAALALARSRALATTQQQDLVDILQQFTRIFADPHFNVGPDCKDDWAYIPSGSDFWAAYDGGTAKVIDVKAGSVAEQRGIRPGWRLISVGGKPVDEAVAAVFGDYLPAPDALRRDFGLNMVAAGRLYQPRSFVFEHGGGRVTVDLPDGYASTRARPPGPLSVEKRGRTTIIRFNNMLGEAVTIDRFDEAVAAAALDSDSLILDLRDTPSGGNSTVARGILGHFVTKETPYQVHTYPYEERRFKVLRKAVELVLPRKPFYPGRVVALGGRWTGSMGEGLMMGLEAAGVRTIGSRLAGQLGGGSSRGPLPGTHAEMWLPYEALFHVDGRPREDYLPQVALASADRDGAGADPALAEALAELKRPRSRRAASGKRRAR